MKNNFWTQFFALIILIGCIAFGFWVFSIIAGVRTMLLSTSILSILMLVHNTVTDIVNLRTGYTVDSHKNAVWRIIFMVYASVGFGIYFNL